jgi:hypothetical protein
MLAATAVMLPTIQNMNSSYNIECASKKLYQTFQFSQANDKKPLCPYIPGALNHTRAGNSV